MTKTYAKERPRCVLQLAQPPKGIAGFGILESTVAACGSLEQGGMADIDEGAAAEEELTDRHELTDDDIDLVVAAGGSLDAPYVTQSKKCKRADAPRHENEPGLHAFARACFDRLREPLPQVARPAPLDARTAAGDAVAAAVANCGAAREPLRPADGATYALDRIVGRVLDGPSARFVVDLVGPCALPPDSTTLLAAAARWADRLPTEREYTCIVADPPWPSRSAARRAAYDTRGDAWRAPLLALPVADLVAPSGALVAVWATNDKKVARWVVDTLFRAWGVEYVGTWYWLKCTSSGAPVLSIDEHAERKPWEPLVVGVVNASGALDAGTWAPRGASWLRRVPARRAVAAVPGPHSAKPRLDAALASCFRPGAPPLRGLELFGRGAFAGWTVAGDQALPLAA